MKILLMILTLLPTLTFAGPGVSSGDEAGVKYTCTMSGLQDSGYVSTFKNIYGAKPTALLSVPIGETEAKTLDGICSRPENVDEFFLNCVFVDGIDIYQATLHSRGAPALLSTVKKLNSNQPESTLACYLTEM